MFKSVVFFKWGITLFIVVLLAREVLNEATLNRKTRSSFQRFRNERERGKSKTGPPSAKSDGNWMLINGQAPYEEELQYMAFISGLKRKICSAIVTTPSMVITAANCVTVRKYSVTPVSTDGLSVFAGHIQPGKGTELKVKKIHIHPDYLKNEKWSQYMDFAWLDLYGKYQTGPDLILAPLVCPSMKGYYKQMVDDKKECRFGGWDVIYPDSSSTYEVIMYPVLISHRQCIEEWEATKDYDYIINPDFHVCTLSSERSAGTGREGDYGGGLFCDNHIFGVFSFGGGQIYPYLPMSYTRMDMAFPAIAGYLSQMNETTRHECAADGKPGGSGEDDASSDNITATSSQSPLFPLTPIIWYWVPLFKEVLKLNYFDEDLISS